MRNDWILESTKCAKCEQSMTVLLGMGAPGMFRTMELYQLTNAGEGKGSFKCALCSSYYCYECSSYSSQCVRCKASNWLERRYLSDPQVVERLFGSATPVGASEGQPPPREEHSNGTVSLTPQAAGLPPEMSSAELNQYLDARHLASEGMPGVATPALLIAGVTGWWLTERWPVWGAVLGGFAVFLFSFRIFVYVAAARDLMRGILWSCPQCRKPFLVTSQDPSSAWLCRTPGCGYPHFQYWRSKQ